MLKVRLEADTHINIQVVQMKRFFGIISKFWSEQLINLGNRGRNVSPLRVVVSNDSV